MVCLGINKGDETLSYDSPNVLVEMPATEYILPGTFDMSIEGEYKAGITAIDSAGNESDIVEITFPLDVVAPHVPTNVRVVG